MCRLRANFSRLAYPMQDTHIRERKVLLSLFLIAFLSSVFLLPSVFPGFQKRKDEKWNSLMSPLSPALFSTADVENGIWEMGFIISWGLFIPLILISFEVRFFYPLEEKNSENFLDLYSRLRPTPSKGRSLRYVLCYEANRAESMAVGDFGAQSLNRTKGIIIHNHMQHRSKWRRGRKQTVI